MSKNITIYTTNTCGSCHTLKKWLTSKGQEFELVNLDDQPDERQKVIEMTGQMTVPVTVVSSGESNPRVVVGWKPALIASALAA